MQDGAGIGLGEGRQRGKAIAFRGREQIVNRHGWALVRGACGSCLRSCSFLRQSAPPASDAWPPKKRISTHAIDRGGHRRRHEFGLILYAQAADTPRYPASLTKMMTLYVLFGYLRDRQASPSTPTSW